MGCNNSHLRPFFRRCRRRSKKDEPNSTTPKRQPNDLLMIENNHVEGNSSTDLLHGFHFLGSGMRTANLKASSDVSDAPVCVPLLAQSEVSSSQLDFFKMLDDKIQEGPELDSDEDKAEMEQAMRQNIASWRRAINTNGWKVNGTPKLSSSSKSTRCQWDDEGDGG